MLRLSNKTESTHADLYINTCRHRHPLLLSYNTQEDELLRACCSDNCLFGQREANATGISSEYTRIPSVVFVVSETGPLRIELKFLLQFLRNSCARTFTSYRLQLEL